MRVTSFSSHPVLGHGKQSRHFGHVLCFIPLLPWKIFVNHSPRRRQSRKSMNLIGRRRSSGPRGCFILAVSSGTEPQFNHLIRLSLLAPFTQTDHNVKAPYQEFSDKMMQCLSNDCNNLVDISL